MKKVAKFNLSTTKGLELTVLTEEGVEEIIDKKIAKAIEEIKKNIAKKNEKSNSKIKKDKKNKKETENSKGAKNKER